LREFRNRLNVRALLLREVRAQERIVDLREGLTFAYAIALVCIDGDERSRLLRR
jgi:hypothetical protein